MISKEEQNRKTEEAWAKLYQRFEQDGLIAPQKAKERVLKKYPAIKWVAAVTILLICLASAFILTRQSKAIPLALHNGAGEPTLATTLEDGSIVLLGEQTSLHYPLHFAKDKREVSINGKAFFDVSKNAERPFSIDTDNVKVEVLGTSFSIECSESTPFFLSVKSGEVKVILKKNGQTTLVKADETASLSFDELAKTGTHNNDPFNSYLNHLHFKDQRLIDIARVINNFSDSTQLLVSPEIEDKLITVTFSNNSVYTMAGLICIALDLQLEQQDSTLTISAKKRL